MNVINLVLLAKKCWLNKKGGYAQALKNINRIIFACDISYKAEIDSSVRFPHQGLGVVIGDGCIIGRNTVIRQNVTIGGKFVDGTYKYPVIGENVMLGAGAVVLGDVCVGNNAVIGANAVVVKDVPEGAIAVGVPAIIKNSDTETY